MSTEIHDSENERNGLTSEEEEERYFALPATKSSRKNGILLKQRRQKFCPDWERSFPWLKPDNVDESIGRCTVCDKRLVCKKSHLERHEKTYKHQRGMGIDGVLLDDVDADGDTTSPTAPEFLECGKQEPAEETNEYDDSIDVDKEYNLECDYKNIDNIKEEKQSHMRRSKSKSGFSGRKTMKLDRMKLLKRIDRDRRELNEYYHSHWQRQSSSPAFKSTPSRDTFDLFFDSVSASVKTLPPKLAAEIKIRISQIVAEYELRAICEREAALENPTIMEDLGGSSLVMESSTKANVVDGQLTHETLTTTAGITSAPQIFYTFQTKATE